MGYAGYIRPESIDIIFDKLFNQLKEDGLFEPLLKNEEMQQNIKKIVFHAIDSQKLLATSLKDSNFAKELVKGYMIAHLMDKYKAPRPDLSVLFMKESDDPRVYDHALRQLLRHILIARNRLIPKNEHVNAAQQQAEELKLERFINKIMEHADRDRIIEKLLNDLVQEQAEYQSQLRNQLKDFLTEKILRDPLHPLDEAQRRVKELEIERLLDQIMNSKNPQDELEKIVKNLEMEQKQRESLSPKPKGQHSLKNEEDQIKSETRVLGITDIPMLSSMNIEGIIDENKNLEGMRDILNEDYIVELEKETGSHTMDMFDKLTDSMQEAVNYEALDLRLRK